MTGSRVAGLALDDWFLSHAERGNPATGIDRGHGDAEAWTEGNDVTVLVDGATYFPALFEELCATDLGDWIYLTDLQSDGNELLTGPGTEIGTVLTDAATRGVAVRGLLWRSHPAGHGAAQVTNLLMSRAVNDAGGEILLDHRVRRGGSHHQKIVVVHRATRASADHDVAFVGGIDLAHGRSDGPPHHGDEQSLNLSDPRYGDRPPWHDVQLRVRGPAVADVSWTFRERWEDPNPLDVPTPTRTLRHFLGRKPAERGDLAPADRMPAACGSHAVQVLRTYPTRRRPYPFAPQGERSIARAYMKAFGRARTLVYIEDQYLWSIDATRALCAALRENPELHCVFVIPRYPDPSGMLGAASRFGRWKVERALTRAGGDRVAVYDLENDEGTPVYVHAKICVVDDHWMTVGSDNLNRRSWTHDSEICCAIIDADDALPRETRMRLAREHLGLPHEDDAPLADPEKWFTMLRDAATELDRWHEGGQAGPRPPGALRAHPRDRVSVLARPFLHFLHAWFLDPDGRPRGMARSGRY